ncbi:hypothetical protein K0M31_011672 [Melipona bicolor]|uniref:Uncharacterized protein n=1 Tax=Melipona bicolor TaxID=60889 RepID=A0AA40GAU0_9HYME|nr:hypothetical protein K0M31_011672 [Melipona bicolor]
MSEAEDVQTVVDKHDFQSIVEAGSGRSSIVEYLDTYDIPKKIVREYSEEAKEESFREEKKKETYAEDERKSIETEKKEAVQIASSSTVDNDNEKIKHEEPSTKNQATTTGTDGRNENAPVGEWNSLPQLVDRLRAALERSLGGGRREDEPPTLPEDSGVDSEEDFRIRTSMEQALGSCKEPELKKDLKFLEDLLLSDIQTALSRLRETLEKIDVNALARHGAASDPTSKLQLLRLVSSLLSRLQMPEETKVPVLPSMSLSRRRRLTRHTIGVSAEELAKARKWLEEERNSLPLKQVSTVAKEQAVSTVSVAERKPEEIRDKCTKDAINQRQLLEDKNKEIRENNNCAFRGIQQVDAGDAKAVGELNMYQAQYRANSYQERENNEGIVEDSEERSRVSKLAAILRQRAELASGEKYGHSNKFIAKKSKIKRANTIDIPSYLKLQAETLGREGAGCVSLRKPISVGDKSFNCANVTVPTFQPKTENDRKFLALINKNNETPSVASVVPFKTFGRTMDMSSLTNENWNSKFSNIKTTFDKPTMSEEKDNRPSLKSRANKMFPGPTQTQGYSHSTPNYSNYSAPNPQTKMESTTGFRHAPSSPFRKIEKSSPGSPSKVPPSYHWPKNAPVPTNTLKEKARMMFDKETTQQSAKSFRANYEKPGFPRPPWIEHERSENRTNNTITENGKIDYKSFCKQFAPFVGKASSIESRKLDEQRQRELVQRDRVAGVVDGKISFKVGPDKRVVQTQQYPPVERRESKEFETIKGREYGENNFADTTLRGSSSVAVQTGINEEHQDEGRSFRVGPRIAKDSNLVCSNAAVQTSNELDRPTISVNDVESEKQWKPLYREQLDSDQTTSEDPQRFVLDHNQNYHTLSIHSEFNNPVVVTDYPVVDQTANGEQDFRETVPFQGTQTYQEQLSEKAPVKSYEPETNQKYSSSPFVSPVLSNCNQCDEDTQEQREDLQKTPDWSIESSTFPDDQNIQNQDISPEIGVVTRYTCAIATVASSIDSPEPRSEEVAMDSRTSSSPSPSQFSWSRSRPPTNETIASEDEIRRHNLLQQSLVRHLQNEITSLNDPPRQSSNFRPHLTVSQAQSKSSSQSPSSFQQSCGQSNTELSHQSYNQPNIVPSHQQSYNQSDTVPGHQQQSYNQSNIVSNHQQRSYNQASIISGHQQQTNKPLGHQQPINPTQNVHHSKPNFNQTIYQQQNYSRPANFDRPPGFQGPSRFAKYLAPVPQKKVEPSRAHSPGPAAVNRVVALREAYEQAPNSQTKPIHKERSPIPNGTATIDSSDEYLVSCANKHSRSIVLSKSESWHQLALSNRYPRPSKTPTSASSFSQNLASSHPKPPKPRSPSSHKLRSKQFEASSMADSVKKMEDKIKQYFDQPGEHVETKDPLRHRRSPRFAPKGMVGLSRSRTMPGLTDEKLTLLIPAPQQVPLLNVNTADVDKVFDDLFEEATRTDKQ